MPTIQLNYSREIVNQITHRKCRTLSGIYVREITRQILMEITFLRTAIKIPERRYYGHKANEIHYWLNYFCIINYVKSHPRRPEKTTANRTRSVRVATGAWEFHSINNNSAAVFFSPLSAFYDIVEGIIKREIVFPRDSVLGCLVLRWNAERKHFTAGL